MSTNQLTKMKKEALLKICNEIHGENKKFENMLKKDLINKIKRK